MLSTLQELRGLNQPLGCVEANQMPVDQFVRIVARGISLAGAYKQAINLHCRNFFDSHGIEDLLARHKVCHALRTDLALSTLFAVWVDSEEFAREYSEVTGESSPKIRERAQDPKSTFFAKLVRPLWFDTLKEQNFGSAEVAHVQRIKKIALAAKEVDLIDYHYKNINRVHYSARPSLHSFFTERLPATMDNA